MILLCDRCGTRVEDQKSKFCPSCGTLMHPKDLEAMWLDGELFDAAVRPPRGTLLKEERGEKGWFIWCHWIFDLPSDWNYPWLHGLSAHIDGQCPRENTAKVYLYDKGRRNGLQMAMLKVGGRGNDGRCRWCKFFRCSLIDESKRRGQYFNIVRSCPFDKA